MILSNVTLQSFRSYSKKNVVFSPYVTLIIGPNTAGKTNIIEAISMLATGKSFRADQDREMIRWGEEVGRITAEEEDVKLEIVLTPGMVNGVKVSLKKYTVNGVPRRMIDFVGNLHAVLFWPKHMELVTDSPSLRRRYLDSVLVQVDREYRRNLMSYERGLRQRNKLLDFINVGTASRSQLLFWNQLLIKAGSYITDKRAEFIAFINSHQLSTTTHQLIYDKSVISESRLEQYKDEEISAKATLVGPHRDDMVFMVNNQKSIIKDQDFVDLSKYGSRGEQRLAVLWLKLAEVAYIKEKTGDNPVLLLDDIFSELDEEHRELVLRVIAQQQTIITTADREILPILKDKAKHIDIITLKVQTG